MRLIRLGLPALVAAAAPLSPVGAQENGPEDSGRGHPRDPASPTALAAGDVDGDGDMDLFVRVPSRASSRLSPNRLFLNVGEGGFRDVVDGTSLDLGSLIAPPTITAAAGPNGLSPGFPCPTSPQWNDLADGVNNPAEDVAIAGQNEFVYVAGFHTDAGGVPVQKAARYDALNDSWDGMHGGLTGFLGYYTNAFSLAVEVFEGRAYFAGHFTDAGGVPVRHIASWTASTGWMDLGGGVDEFNGLSIYVAALCQYDDGTGNALYAGGNWETAGGVPARGLARWNGTSWSAVGGSLDAYYGGAVESLATFSSGGSTVLVASGAFSSIGGVVANRIAQWDGTSWSPLDAGINARARAMVQFGDDLYVTGDFSQAGGSPSLKIARWDGSSWSDVGGGFNSYGDAIAVYDDGSGPALFVGGNFTTAGGISANRLARWDGNSWSTFPGGEVAGGFRVSALAAGAGCLAIGGQFTQTGNAPASNVATWGVCCP